MPLRKQPKSLTDLSINSFCNIVLQMVVKGVNMTQKTNDAVQIAEDKIEEVFAKRAVTSDVSTSTEPSSALSDAKSATLDLLMVKYMVKRHGDFASRFMKYVKHLPHNLFNEIFVRALNNLFKVAGAYHEDDVELFMDGEWSLPPRLSVAFRILLKCMLSSKISELSLNRVTNEYFTHFANYLIKTSLYKDKEYMDELNEKNELVFIKTVLCCKDDLASLNTIKMRNCAHRELLWCIACECPNLLHLDLSGEMFDLRRFCVYEVAAGAYVTAIDEGVRQYEETNFFDSLCGLYGKKHTVFEDTPKGCFKLKTLLLPDCIWESSEEGTLVEQMFHIFDRLIYLEEVTGACLLYILCKLNEADGRPLVLNFKKFDGKTGGHRLVGIDPKRFKKIQLPLVKDVIFSLNVFMKPVALQMFPNMRNLLVTPYDTRGYSFDNILPYLRNLNSCDIEFFQEVTLSQLCILGNECRNLKSLTITCLAVSKEDNILSSEQISKKESKRHVTPPFIRLDKRKKHVYEVVESPCVQDILSEYPAKLANIPVAMHENEVQNVPKFSKLHTLQLFDMIHVDNDVLYKCVKGSPHLETLTIVVSKLNSDSKEQINDDFIGHLAPLLKWVRDVTFALDRDEDKDTSKMKLTRVTISHMVYFCHNISSISRIGDWDVSMEEIQGLNYYFKKNNFHLSLH